MPINRNLVKIRSLYRRRHMEFGLALRVTVAAMLSLVLAQAFGLRLPLWAVLTSIIVSQLSLGSSLKATIDYFLGTMGGVIYGGLIAVFVPHPNEVALLGVMALALAPLALLAAFRPSMKAAPVTAVIVLLLPEMNHINPMVSILDRIYEVGLGGIMGVLVSSLVVPSSAFRQTREAGAVMLERMSVALGALLVGINSGLDAEALHRIQDGIGQGVGQLSSIAAEAEHERRAQLAIAPTTGPLQRTLLRLRHDLVMIGRAAGKPMPEVLVQPLQAPLDAVRIATTGYLRAAAAALRAGHPAPSRDALTAALGAYATTTARVRADGLTRGLPGDVIERFFAIGFALEQMGQNCRDLERCLAEWGTPPSTAYRSVLETEPE